MPENIGYQFNRLYASPIETYRQVNTITQRNAIPPEIRWEGMECYVVTENQDYQLVGGLDNSNWVVSGDSPINPTTHFKGFFNATTLTPPINNINGIEGDEYKVTNGGVNVDFGAGDVFLETDDIIIFYQSQWRVKVRNSDAFNEIDYSNFNYDQHISQNKLKNYLVNNSLRSGNYKIKHPKELSAIDNINLVYNNGEHNAFPSLTKTKEGKLITGYRASPVDHNSPIARAEIMISSDNGNTFGAPIIVDDGSDFTTTDFGIRSCSITQLSTGDLIATYWVNDGPVGNVYMKFSSDGGITWGVRTALIINSYSPNVIGCENGWLEIGGEFILPIFSGSSYSASNAGFVRTSDFISFTYTALDTDDEGTTETRGYIDNSNNTIIFFYQYPVNPNAVLYRTVYDPINNIVISPKTAVSLTDYSSSRSDILFDENRGEMYLFARKPYPQGGKISVSTDKGLNFVELFDFENLDDRTVYGDFVQVNQSEALFVFATEDIPNGETSKMWMTTFNLSPVQTFSFDGTNVVELSSNYNPKIVDFTITGDNRYVKKAGDVMTGSLQSPLLIAGGRSGGSAPLRIIGTGAGTSSFGQLMIYESDGVTLQAYIGKASGSNGHIYIGSSISGKALVLESGGTLSYNGTGRFTGDVTVPDEAYGAGWDGSLEVPTKNAVYDKIESISSGIVYTTGDQTIRGTKSFIPNLSDTDPAINVFSNVINGKGIEASVIGGGGSAIYLRSNLTGGSATSSTMLLFDNVSANNDVTPIRVRKQGVEVASVDYLGNINTSATIKTGGYTVATLPTGVIGMIAYVTDAASISYRATATGGGSDTALVFYDGTNWIYH